MSSPLLRPLVVHADDLGLSRSFNAGIFTAATRGALTSTCVRVNGAAYDEAVAETAARCPGLGVGIHLNIVEGRTTRRHVPRSSPLCTPDGRYRASFPALLLMQQNQALLSEVEVDYRVQIERALADFPHADHLNSHQHSHAVPAIFELVCRLAVEYAIPCVRLPREPFHRAGPWTAHARPWYAANMVKFALLNRLAQQNERAVQAHGLWSNEWMIGIAYTGFMTSETLHAGLGAVPAGAGIVEVLLHPCAPVSGPPERHLDESVRRYAEHPARARELDTLLDAELPEQLCDSGWQPVSYRLRHLDLATAAEA
jgi:predicted glycoside hydrolase/deacetylase ChbG (UPF0249 family)